MLRTFIIDDEIDAINSIVLIIREYCPDIEIVGMATTMNEALKEIPLKKPDLLILDIEMPFGSGFDLLEKIPDRNFEIIFVTAYNNHAIKAFKYSAVDYLLKPIDIDDFISAINRVIARIGKQSSKSSEISVLLENIKKPIPTKLAINTNDGIIYISFENIVRMEGDGSYTNVFLKNNQKILVSKTLKDFQELLFDRNLFRPHHSHLINIDHVICFHHKDGGAIEMSDGALVPLARRKKEEFLEIMSHFAR